MKKNLCIVILSLFIFVTTSTYSYAFWVWTPKTKALVNPKFAVKDSPKEQFDWAMKFFKLNDFKRSAEEFERLTEFYPDSDLAPEAQYYTGRSFEENGKYYFAFRSYQKTLDEYPYTKRMEEIIEREYNIANFFQTEETPKLMDMELSLSMDRAVEIYGKVVDNSPFGEYADQSLYKMADVYRRMQKYDKAVEAYERIVNDYPESKLVPEAKYQLAYTKYEASLDPEYDQASTRQAMEDFSEISENTPIPAIAKEASKVLDELRRRKADSIIKVAEFYEKRKKYKSALIYYKNVVKKFNDTDVAEYADEKIKYLKILLKS